MTTPDSPSPVLEEAAQAFADATAKPPYLFDLSVEDGRRTVDSTQDGDFPDPAATRQDLTVPGGPTGEVSITVYRPAGAVGTLPVVLYTHGAGWVFGDAHTHDRLVRELTTRAEAGRAGVPQARQPGSPVLPGPHPPRAQGRAPLDVRSRLRWPDRRRA
jgi:acetyl esterase